MVKKIYFTVGPSQVYPTVKRHILKALEEDIPSINHRGPKFAKILEETTSNLRKLLGIPDASHIFFLSCALEGMERVIQNMVYKSSFHIITGAFSKKFYQTALDYQRKAVSISLTSSAYKKKAKSITPNIMSEGSQNDIISNLKIPKEVELIALTQNETSTGISIPMDDIYKLKEKYPEKLIAIDVVSSVPYVDIDFKKIDAVFFSVQKGLGLPAGLGVLVVNEKAIRKGEDIKDKGVSVGSYHCFKSLLEKAKVFQTPATPNVLNIYLLGKVLGDMRKVGLGKIKKDIDAKAKLIYEYFDNHKELKPAVQDSAWRSQTTIIVNTQGKTKKILEKLTKKGIVISKGYGDKKDDQIRIANFPAHKIVDVKKLLKSF